MLGPSLCIKLDCRTESPLIPSIMAQDYVDHALAQWARERPDLDASVLGILNRVLRLATHIRKRDEQLLKAHGLQPWAYDVLSVLRRQGPPYALTPTKLREATLLTSGGMTNRLDRLEAEGWIERSPDPADRRGVRVRLSAQGRRMVDRMLELRLESAAALLEPLRAADRRMLARLLRELLLPLSVRAPGML